MTLADLDAQFIHTSENGSFRRVDTLAEADGLLLLCPTCNAARDGRSVHSVICWFAGVPQDRAPQPGRWYPSGTGLADLTFVGPGLTSVWLQGSKCGAHFHIVDGAIHPC